MNTPFRSVSLPVYTFPCIGIKLPRVTFKSICKSTTNKIVIRTSETPNPTAKRSFNFIDRKKPIVVCAFFVTSVSSVIISLSLLQPLLLQWLFPLWIYRSFFWPQRVAIFYRCNSFQFARVWCKNLIVCVTIASFCIGKTLFFRRWEKECGKKKETENVEVRSHG